MFILSSQIFDSNHSCPIVLFSGNVIEVRDDDDGKKKKKGSSPKKPKGKLVACGECEGCKRKACKKCKACTGTPRKRCIERQCTNIRRVEEKKDGKKSSKGGKKKAAKDDSDDDSDSEGARSKPRIHLKLPSAKKGAASDKKKQGKKRKAAPEPEEEENGNAKKKKRSKSSGSSDGSDDEEEDSMFDVKQLQSEHDQLDETFDAARGNFTQRGSWKLPAGIESKFKDVAKIVLGNAGKADVYDIFMEAVSDEDVPGYSEMIAIPMDFGTMLSKVEQGEYGEGSDAAAKLYDDFLLVFDNCHTFNSGEGEVMDEATLVFKAMPLIFAKSCQEVMGARKGKKY